MRRGTSLIELLVALAVLATLGTVTLRLMFAGDRALQTQAERATATSAALRLLHVAADDVRAAASVGIGEPPIVQRPEGRVTYSRTADGTCRRAGEEIEEFPGVTLSLTGGDRLCTITVRGKSQTLTTVVCRRRWGS